MFVFAGMCKLILVLNIYELESQDILHLTLSWLVFT